MPLPYTGRDGEKNFENDFVQLLTTAGWEPEILHNCTVDDLIENWRKIIFERNRLALNNVPLSDGELHQLMDKIKQEANTPVKANLFLNTADRGVSLKRDNDSPDTAHAGKEIYLNLFDCREIAGGSSRYQIAEQTIFLTDETKPNRRGDVTLLIDGIPVIHIELKASGIDIFEACTQIRKYANENVFTGFMGLVQVFWAITPEDALYFANPGDTARFNPAFYFRWGDRDNHLITNWRELITGKNHILSIPEAHKMIGYYAVADQNADVLKVCRSYQYTAIKEIVKRTAMQKWGDHDQKGGFIWCTTGGGKTMTSFKAGQLIIAMNLADKVVFVVDRKALDEQSTREYNSFERSGESISSTASSMDLFRKLLSNDAKDSMVMTSIQKLSNISQDTGNISKSTLETIERKRIVFIIDEAHRSQFGAMHKVVKSTFYNALFFGFTGTPIMKQNMKAGEQTTESVFGRCLAVYSLATGIRDGNVLGFWPEYISIFDEQEVREKIGLHEAKIKSEDDLVPGTPEYATYKYFIEECPLVSVKSETGAIKEKGIEDYLDADYDTDNYREAVVNRILKRLKIVERGDTHQTLFHGMLATSSIPEAYEYWKIFQSKSPNLHVTALFDPNINGNEAGVVEKENWLIEIVNKYNQDFGTKYTRKTDPSLLGFKSDLIARLAHKKPYEHIGNNRDQCLDIIIVVDQLLTGFDSKYLNVLYMDKTLENEALIQAISRTNRVLDNSDKPYGMVKFFRKPNTMKQNLEAALELYCEGDSHDVQEKELKENIREMNDLYADICRIFAHDKIKHFEVIPTSPEDQQKFRKDFEEMRCRLRAAILQGFEWTNEYGAMLDFDEPTYRILYMRYLELPSSGGGGGTHNPKTGYGFGVNVTSVIGAKIDSAYLESRFKILTISDIERREKKMDDDVTVINDIKAHIGALPAYLQPYALRVLEDIRNGIIHAQAGKTFMEYILEYRHNAITAAIHAEAEKFGIDENGLYEIYSAAESGDIDQLKLDELEKAADINKAAAVYGCSAFAARKKLHAELTDFIHNRKAG